MGRTTDAAAMDLGYRRLTLTTLTIGLGLVVGLGNVFAQEPPKAAPPKSAPSKAAGAADQAPAADKAKRSAPKKAKAGPAGEAKPLDAEAALDQARKALSEGKLELAGQLAGDVLGSTSKTPRNTARALAVRGEVNLQKARIAEAIVDLDGALWVTGGLQGAERDSATAARQRAMQQAGLGSPPAPVQTGPAPVVTQSATRPASATPSARSPEPREAVAEAAPQGASGSGIGGFFSKIFTGGSGNAPAPVTGAVSPAKPALSSSEPQRAEAASRPAPTATPAPTPARASAAVVPRSAAQAPAAAVPAAVSAPVRAAAEPVGSGPRIQLAAVRSREEADALARRVKAEHKDAIGTRTVAVEEEVYGNMGRFYRVRIGPFASVPDTQSACARIRNAGIDCMALTAE